MATYLMYAWPTVLLSVLLGLALGRLTWGRTRRSAAAQRDALRQQAFRYDRDLADRDATIAILREELAAEAGEAARLRRLLGEPPPVPSALSEPTSRPGAGDPAAHNGHREPSPAALAVAAARRAAGTAPAAGVEAAGGRRARRRSTAP
jgi:hypothetical protein